MDSIVKAKAAEQSSVSASGDASRVVEERGPVIPDVLSILPVRNMVLFPGTVVPLTVGRAESIKLLEETLPKTKVIGVIAQRSPNVDAPGPDALHAVGAAALVLKLVRQAENSVMLIVHGLDRFRIRRVIQTQPYLQAEVEVLASGVVTPASQQSEAAFRNLRDTAVELFEMTPDVPEEMRMALMNMRDASRLTDFVAGSLSLETPEKQQLLEELNVAKRVELLQQRVITQLEIARIQQKLQ
jgi:ATP-dependent Lon protease